MTEIAYKVFAIRRGVAYTLGMGKAKQVPLSDIFETDGGKFGFSAAKTEAGARAVLRYVLSRKEKPIPKGRLEVLRVVGRYSIFENRWRIIFRKMSLWDSPKLSPSELDLDWMRHNKS